MAKAMVPTVRSSTPLSGWDPLREFDDLHERFNQLVRTVFGGAVGGDGTGLAWTPLADVTETEEAYLIEVELPGVRRDDITVETTGSELHITGELTRKERAGWLRSRTRRVGRFAFRTTLPAEINADEIRADLADGVLTVRVPKTEAAKPRRIQITSR